MKPIPNICKFRTSLFAAFFFLIVYYDGQAQCSGTMYLYDYGGCGGNRTLSVYDESGYGTHFRWYKKWSSGAWEYLGETVSDLGTGEYPVYVTGPTTFGVAFYNENAMCESTKVELANVSPVSPPLAWANGHSCEPGTAFVQADGDANVSYFTLYKRISNNYVSIGSSSSGSFTIADFDEGMQYYVRGFAGSCPSGYNTVSINVVRPDMPTVTGDTQLCHGESTILAASGGSEANYRWYNGNDLIVNETGSQLAAGPFTNGSKFYYASYVVTVDGGQCESPKREVYIGVTNPIAPVPQPVTRCGPGDVDLSTDSPMLDGYLWYDQNGSQIGSTAYNILTISGEGLSSYTAKVNINGCWSPMSASATVTITHDEPPQVSQTPGCGPSSQVQMHATYYGDRSGNYYIEWYTAAEGGVYEGSIPVDQNESTATYSAYLPSDKDYWVSVYDPGVSAECRTERTYFRATTGSAVSVYGSGYSCESGTAYIEAGSLSSISTYYLYKLVNGSYEPKGSSSTGAFTLNDFDVDDEQYSSEYYLKGLATSGCLSPYFNVPITVMRLDEPSIEGQTQVCYNSNTVLTASGGPPDEYRWFKNGVLIPGETGSVLNTGPLTVPTTYTASYEEEGLNGAVCESPERSVSVSIVQIPQAPTGYSDERCGPGALTLHAELPETVVPEDYSVNWYATSEGGIPLTTGLSYATGSLSQSTTFYITTVNLIAGCESPLPRVAITATIKDPALDNCDVNYIISNDILVANIETGEVDGLSAGKRLATIQFFDGLGRPLQTIAKRASPIGNDIVQPVVYDGIGREYRKYLPVVTGQNSGRYLDNSLIIHSDPEIGDYIGVAASFYDDPSSKIADDDRDKPFAETIFEPSPLNRVKEQGAPGADWHPVNGKTIRKAYLTNGLGEVRMWNYIRPSAAHPLGLVDSPGPYGINELYKNVTTDEEGNDVIEYIDKKGRTVLKRIQAVGNPSAIDDSNYASTYYIYDDLDQLVCVIPPEAANRLTSQYFHSSSDDQDKENFLGLWAFRYRYDERRRMIIKQVPGADSLVMVYDKRDRLVLTQDGNQRKTFSWSFTKYDELNRPILTGIKDTLTTNPLTQAEMQSAVNAHYAKAGAKWGEHFDETGPVHGYSNRTYPVITTGSIADPNHYLTVTYYDNYDFRSQWLDNYAYSDEGLSETVNNILYEQPETESLRVTGQVTGSKVKVLDGGLRGRYTWLKSVNYYDEKYRAIQSVADNYKGGQERITSLYDFTGKVLKTKTEHTTNEISWKELVNTVVVGNNLMKTKLGLGWNAGAVTVEELPAGVDGWIECVISEPDIRRAFGLTEVNEGEHRNTIDYGFWHDGTQAVFYEDDNDVYALASPVKSGDVIRIERSGTAMKYYVNGELLQTTYGASSAALIGDACIDTGSGSILLPRASFNSQAHSVQRRFIYDHAGRLTEIWHQINTAPEVRTTYNEYNALGQLIDKKLHSTEPLAANAHQSVDYRYNIRGWLTDMNETDLTSGDAGDPVDHFSFQLAYNEVDIGIANQALFNGNISAMKWSTNLGLNEEKMNAYKYRYDNLNRIMAAEFKTGSGASEAISWSTPATNAFSTSNYQYDLNGNIMALTRKGKAGSPLDILTYEYGEGTARSNRLLTVTDAGSQTEGFNEQVSAGVDYEYDSNGNLVWDKNKGGVDVLVNGDFASGIANWVVSDPGGRLTFQDNMINIVSHATATSTIRQNDIILRNAAYVVIVDMVRESGNIRINVGNGGWTSINTSGKIVLTARSVSGNDFVVSIPPTFSGHINSIEVKGIVVIEYNHLNLPEYISKGPQQQLRYIYDASGRKISQEVYSEGGFIAKKSDYAGEFFYENDTLRFISHEEGRAVMAAALPEYQYHLKDHLGNVRLTFTTNDEEDIFQTDFETADQPQFKNYTRNQFELFDHTDGTTAYQYSQLLNGGNNSQVGLAKTLSVMPGDVIKAEAYAKYWNAGGESGNLTGFAAALTSAFGLNGSMTGDPAMAYDALDAYGTVIAGGYDHSEDVNAPKAYLNILIFDRDYNFLDAAYRQIGINDNQTSAPPTKDPHGYLSREVYITEPGYVFIFLSNENPAQVDVYFDDMKITHTKSPVVQMDDYYPFGLTFNSYQRENSLEQKYLYNGKEEQDALELNTYDFGWRQYDPAIARWNVVDPLAEKRYWLNPYNFVQNNPLNRFDPNGLTDYTLNRKTGQVTEVVYDDKEKQKANLESKTDRVVKSNRRGEIKYKKNGEARTAIGDVEKGILKDGQNFRDESNIIAVGGEGQPTEKGVEAFALRLSTYVGKEIGGAYFGGEQTTHMTIGMYEHNRLKKTRSMGHLLGLRQGLSLTGFFHTHPSANISDSDRLVPSDADLDSRDAALQHNPSLKFFLLTEPENYGEEYPKKIPYATGYSRRLR